MKRIKLMPDYDCHPLWHHEDNQVGNIDPSSLNLSKDLLQKLDTWQQEFNLTLNRNNPTESGFPNSEAKVKFVATGHEIALQIKTELKPVKVMYYDINQKCIRSI